MSGLVNILDCTLRDGGYYNAWDFRSPLVAEYLNTIAVSGVDYCELGLRSVKTESFKGLFAFCPEEHLRWLPIPSGLKVGVMVNASELLSGDGVGIVLERLFPVIAANSCVNLVRIACHLYEVAEILVAIGWLRSRGYKVGINLMQLGGQPRKEVVKLATQISCAAPDVLYFADSLGSMNPVEIAEKIGWLREGWSGDIGVHTHDNKGMALQNSLRALEEGATWVDCTVTGMGRGPGNARTEELAIEVAERRGQAFNMVPLMRLIREYFKPMQEHYGWGTNSYYYLAGKYGIHPTYIQEMLSDSRYDEEDILSVIEHLKEEGGKKFSLDTLDAARHFYQGERMGSWNPATLLSGREVLLLGSGPGVSNHRHALESYIRRNKPLVMALNTQSGVQPDLIDVRVACHPVRLLADCGTHTRLPQPLITPVSNLPEDVKASLSDKKTLDFGLKVEPEGFEFGRYYCSVPTSLVIAYALAIVTSGKAARMLLAGFDGYGADDPRSQEMQNLLSLYQSNPEAVPLVAVTPSRYSLPAQSIYAL
jgi:4-hydroxy 2-oxovalerate aldolase